MAFAGSLPLVTLTFIIVISVLGIVFHLVYDQQTVILGPALLTTTGIFATFLGIAIGLYRFDTANVQASIPALLEGLKTAFFASVFGVGFAISLKLREYVFGVPAPAGPEPDDVTAADLVRHLRDIRDAVAGRDDTSLVSQIKTAHRDQLTALRGIDRSLAGDESVMQELRLLRQDTVALRVAIAGAIQHMSEAGTLALVEALHHVVRDFNVVINEQFGENFRRFNDAVGSLITWQQDNKHIIDTAASTFADVSRGLRDMMSVVKAADDRTAQPDAVAGLERAIAGLSARLADVVEESRRDAGASTEAAVMAMREAALVASNQLAEATERHQDTIARSLADNTALIRGGMSAIESGMTATNRDFIRHVGGLLAKPKPRARRWPTPW